MKPQYTKINLATDTKVIYALSAYIIMTLSWFLINGSVSSAALLGFIIYGTYAFTLAAILPSYTLTMGLTEIVWGTLLFIIATMLTNKINGMI